MLGNGLGLGGVITFLELACMVDATWWDGGDDNVS